MVIRSTKFFIEKSKSNKNDPNHCQMPRFFYLELNNVLKKLLLNPEIKKCGKQHKAQEVLSFFMWDKYFAIVSDQSNCSGHS